MAIGTNYTPQYIGDLDDVPISGPDDYQSSEKRKAIFHAEASLELDTNDGDPIPDDNLTNSHIAAALNLATHVLTHAAEDPSDVTLGDMASGGGNLAEYSSRYLDEYNRLVDVILQSGAGSDDGTGHGNFSHAVNTRE